MVVGAVVTPAVPVDVVKELVVLFDVLVLPSRRSMAQSAVPKKFICCKALPNVLDRSVHEAGPLCLVPHHDIGIGVDVNIGIY